MNFSVVLAVLLTVLAIETSPAISIANCQWHAMSCLTIMLLTIAMAHFQTQRLKLVRRNHPTHFDQAFDRHYRAFCFCWICAAGAILFVVRWPAVVHDHLLPANLILADELMILAPILIPLFCSWIIFSEVETVTPSAAHPPATRSNQIRQLNRQRFRILENRTRIELLLVLVPALLFFAIRDFVLLQTPAQPPLAAPQHSEYSLALSHAALLIGLLVAAPVIIRSIWRSQTLIHTTLGQEISTTCQQMGVAVRDIRLWRTDERIINAVVIGILPGKRQLLISDGLLKHFSREEIQAITRHEASHLRRNHLVGRVAVLCIPFSLFYCWQVVATGTQSIRPHAFEFEFGGGGLALLLGAAAIYGFISLGVISRLFEFDADIFGCCRLGGKETPLEIDKQRLRVYHCVLKKMDGLFAARFSWLHPRTTTRRRLLVAISRKPQLAGRYLRLARVSLWMVILLGLLIPAVTALVHFCWCNL